MVLMPIFQIPQMNLFQSFMEKSLYGLQIYHKVLSLKLKMMMITI